MEGLSEAQFQEYLISIIKERGQAIPCNATENKLSLTKSIIVIARSNITQYLILHEKTEARSDSDGDLWIVHCENTGETMARFEGTTS